MSRTRGIQWLLLLAPFLAIQQPQRAEAQPKDDFETGWAGIRIGAWYRPWMKMEVQISGKSLTPARTPLRGTKVDIEKDLAHDELVVGDTMFRPAIFEGEVLLETRWLSLSFWHQGPYWYEDRVVLERDVDFGGVSFPDGALVKSNKLAVP